MMQTVGTPENPAPAGGMIEILRTGDGLDLRCMRFVPQGTPRGTVMIASGRAETIEKYFETIGELLARNLAVVAFDWRGQGGSARQLADRDKGHVTNFDEYQHDLQAVLQQALAKHCPKPWFALGHSMGGAILLEHAYRGDTPFLRIVLCAPMIDLALRYPRLARFAALALNSLGFGRAYVPTGGPAPVVARGFDGNPLTTDRLRFERLAKLLSQETRISLGDPTIGWVRAAFLQMARFEDPAFSRAISTPLLVFAPQNDVVTDSFATERFCANLKTGRLIWMAQARHEILMEQDHIRARFWAAFDTFVPGSTEEEDRLAHRKEDV